MHQSIRSLVEHSLLVKLYEKSERDSEAGNNIKGNFEKYLPNGFPLELIDVMHKWKVVSKSPYSYSFYDITNKGWDDTGNDKFYRISDHWNFKTRYDDRAHCKLDTKVPDGWWTLAKYDAKTGVYKMLKTYPTRPSAASIKPGILPDPELYKDVKVTSGRELTKVLGGGDKRGEISALVNAGIFKAVDYKDIVKGYKVPTFVKKELEARGWKEGVVYYRTK